MLQGIWTNGKLMLTLGLDQMLHCWTLQTEDRKQTNPDAGAQQIGDAGFAHAMSSTNESLTDKQEDIASRQNGVEISWLSSAVVQVLEPAALDVCNTHCGRELQVLVTGRGTQLLKLV